LSETAVTKKVKKAVDVLSDFGDCLRVNEIKIRPSAKFHALVTLAGSVNAAAHEWGIPYTTLKGFVERKGSLPGNMVATVVERTGLPYDELFIHD
jgi:hypothetical protein